MTITPGWSAGSYRSICLLLGMRSAKLPGASGALTGGCLIGDTLGAANFRRTRASGAPGGCQYFRIAFKRKAWHLSPRALKLPSCRLLPTEPREQFLFGIECAPRSTPSYAYKQCTRA